jgi:hypothetical protein
MTRSGHEFIGRVLRAPSLRGFEILVIWTLGDRQKRNTAHLSARHPYGPWRTVTITDINKFVCNSKTGSPMVAADVAVRLRRIDKGSRVRRTS